MTGQEKHELIQYRIARAKETLKEVESHIQNNFLNNAVSRIYYSCYYALSSLFLDRSIQAKSHSGVKQMLGLYFVQTGIISKELNDFYSLVFELRQKGDYDDYVVFEQQEIIALVDPAKDFISRIESLLSTEI
jgi:uncharacterized protein (UPF0332 family)